MRPEPKTMSLSHLLDDYLNVYRDGGRRQEKIRDEIERRFAALEKVRSIAAQTQIAENHMEWCDSLNGSLPCDCFHETLRDALKEAADGN